MIAADVVHQQAAVCAQRMQNVESKIDNLAGDIQELKTEVKADIKELQVTIKAVEQQSIRLDDRWKLFTVIAAILGALGTLMGIFDALKTIFGG